jgi:peptide/nickel transport system substrate-binding protein
VREPEQALSDLLTGKCDLLDPSVQLDSVTGLLMELQQAGKLRAYFSRTMTLEQLAFGLRPASYDNGYTLGSVEDRPDFFADSRVRQAIALCLDRQQVVDTVLYGLVDVPNTFVLEGHPLYNPATPVYAYDPVTAAQLLEQAGWRDTDNDAATPRVADGVFNVKAGTPLILNYYTTGATQRRQVSEILSKSLQACGIGVNLMYMPFDEFYAPGPNGVLFGRRFDLAQFAMGVPGVEPPCAWYTSPEVPAEPNAWVGTNVSGYQNPTYDSACQVARQALPSEPAYAQRYQEAQAILAQDLPFVPLYFRLKVAASRPDLCGFDLSSGSEPDLWSLENIRSGAMCP